ncbi:hypothetical protein [Pseudonocardia sp. ICBG601]|uniref:phage tail termination protein n=1 Tax=Pseudonocardia sp. ICBG601 TaxID=2846759 RepID=UPI001CF651BD|nr:hypothetical protein [Pseudonocardia sp. ICBG601]
MSDMEPFPDIEQVLVTLFADIAPTVTEAPEGFTPPMVRVSRTGGSDDGLTDSPIVETTCYGATRAESWALDGLVRQRVLACAATVVDTVLIDTASTVTPAQQLSDPRLDIRAVSSSYRFGLRRRSPYMEDSSHG